jgi:2',3'-cyclic-nucleotide 2'-phosphodiesterase (5'-nucleotidase family)
MKLSAAISLFLLLPFSASSQDASIDTLTIIHWNDVHAQNAPFSITSRTGNHEKYNVGGMMTLAVHVKELRAASKNPLVLDGGDEFQGTPISNITHGRSQIDLVNGIMPDAMVIGNHEFDYTADTLREVLRAAKFPILCANVFDLTTGTTFAPPYIIKTVGRMKIAIVGITAPGLMRLTMKSNLSSVSVLNRDSTLSYLFDKIKNEEHPTLIVLVSHEGIDADSALAEKFSEINVIVAAHDHRALQEPKKINHTIIVEAGSKGQYLGKLDLVVDLKDRSVKSYMGKLIEMRSDDVRIDWTMEDKVDMYERIVNDALKEVIGTLEKPLDRETKDSPECNLGDFETDAFRSVTAYPAAVAFVNTSGLRKNLEGPQITLRDIWEVNPFGNALVYFTVRGDTLMNMMEWQASRPSLQVSGLKYTIDKSKMAGQMVASLQLGGKPLDSTAQYSVITNEFIGDHFDEYFGFKPPPGLLLNTGIIDRDAVIDFVKQKKDISEEIEGRIRVLSK